MSYKYNKLIVDKECEAPDLGRSAGFNFKFSVHSQSYKEENGSKTNLAS